MAPRHEDADTRIRRRRHLISQVLVAGLIAVAFAEPVSVVHTALQKNGVSIYSLALFIVYFLTALRFFVGDILHLDEDERTEDDRRGAEVKWFYDLSFIVFECVILIFLGNLTSIEQSAASRVDYFDLLGLLLAVDVFWILSMGALRSQSKRRPASRFWRLWCRREIPYGWAGLNAGLLVVVWALRFHSAHDITAGHLWVLVGVNVIVFIIDVFVLNYYMDREPTGAISP